MTRRCLAVTVVLAALLTCAGCAAREPGRESSLPERSRDSVISRSVLPGAATVGRALGESDQAGQRAAALDSLPH